MAVDTQTKRRSAVAATLAFLMIAPVPDGSITSVDREHVLGIYAGIAPGPPAGGLGTDFLHIFSEDVIEPDHVSDTGNNVLTKGDIEVKGRSWLEGICRTESGRIRKEILIDNTDSPYTVLAIDHEIFVDTDTTAVTINLPVGVAGMNYRIINTGSSGNDITLAPDGAELLTGVNASRTMSDGSVIILTYNSAKGWW